MTPEQEQSACAAWLVGNGFVFDKVGERWIAPQDNPWKLYAMSTDQALFFYRICQKARLDEATKARDVAFNHRMDSGHDVALVLAGRVKGLTPPQTPNQGKESSPTYNVAGNSEMLGEV